MKLDPNEWQGFAFGTSVDRLAMIKYKIDDIRLFYSGDLRFIAGLKLQEVKIFPFSITDEEGNDYERNILLRLMI